MSFATAETFGNVKRKDRHMNIRIDTHSHTLASGHAYNTLREMAAMAAEKGLEGLAVTEHAPEMPGSCQLYYFQNLRVVPRTLYNIHLLLGTELNIMDREGNVDLPQGVIRDLDIAIASLHTPCFKDERIQENVMQAYLSVMENPYIDIIGHPDDGRFPADYEVLAREAKRTGTFLEVNNSSLRPDGYRANTTENCLKMLEACKKEGTMVVFGSDAHFDLDIAEYPFAEELVRKTAFPEELVANTSYGKLISLLKHRKKV